MNLSVSGKQIDVGQALRQHVETAMPEMVAKYFDRALEGAVSFSRDRHLFRCDLAVHVGRSIQLHAEGEADDIYRAFDAALERMATRLRRHKSRLRAHHARDAEIESQAASHYILPAEQPEQAESADGDPVVVADLKTKIMFLTVGEAVMHLDFAKQPALMFRNRAHGGLNMIYRRNDGTIGWVDPQIAAQGR